MDLKCAICDKLITSKHPWNPEIEEKEDVNFHQFDKSDTILCEECYKKYQKLFSLYHEVK